MYDSIIPEFESSFNKFCELNSFKNPLYGQEKKEEAEAKAMPDDLKSLYREIAIKTHPDKNRNESDEVFLTAAVAKKDNNISELISIAQKLKINTSKMDFNSVEAIEDNIKKTEKEIESKTNSYPWLWFFGGKNDKLLLRFYCCLSVI